MTADREDAASLIALARERIASRDHHGAVLLLREVTAGPGANFADAFALLGMSLAMIGQPSEALTALDRAVALNPRYVEAQLNRAVVLGALGRDEEAQKALADAGTHGGPDASGFPSVVANRLANAHGDLGAQYREAGALAEAEAQFRRALELRPTFADLRLALARTLLERGDLAGAAREADQVLVQRPNWLDAMLLRGLSGYLSGDLEAADAAWTRAAAAHPEEPRVEIYRALLARRRPAGG